MLENAWYCAAWSHEIRSRGVLGRKLLNRHVVFFRDSKGQIQAIGAVCPHRGGDLSLGHVVKDTLECPLHGWCFDSAGTCVAIPSQPESLKISPSARVPSYLVSERHGIVWIWVGPQRESLPNAPQHDVWEEREERHRQFNPPKLWRCTFINAVENAIDTTHIPFVHVRTLGSTQPRLYPQQRIIVDKDLRGFSGEDSPDSPWGGIRTAEIMDGMLGRLVTRLLGMRTIRREHYRFDLGGSLFYQIEWDTGSWDMLAAHSTPADQFHTWVFGVSVRTRATHWLGNIAQKWFVKTLLKEDEAAVASMLSNDPALLPSAISVMADTPMLTFRRIYDYHLGEQERP